MDIPRGETPDRLESRVKWVVILGRVGHLLFSLAILGIGLETLICAYVFGHSPDPHHRIIPVIPWVPTVVGLSYPVGVIFILCGVGLVFRRTSVTSALVVGIVIFLCGTAFDLPRHP